MKQYKYSKYLIITDYVDDNNRLIYSLLTGKMLLINNAVSQKVTNNDLNIHEDTKRLFLDAEILVDAELDELNKLVTENLEGISDRNVFSFTIFPSSNCQLGCHYCGQHHVKSKVSPDLYKDVLAHVSTGVAKPEKTHLAMGWFGGEPLLGMNVIEELTPELKRIAEVNGCSYSARITTNGLLLNCKNFQKLLDCDVRDITISLDGTKKAHDARRPTKGGEGSFDVIINNLIEVFNSFDVEKEQVDIMLRINVDMYNMDDVIPLLELLGDLKFQNKIKHFDIAPVHAWGNDAHLRSTAIEKFADFKIDCYIKLFELGFMTAVPVPGRVKVLCQAVTPDSLYMQTDGSLFDCSELPLVPIEISTKKLGHISNSGLVDKDHRHYYSWNNDLLMGKLHCAECKILPVCGGGCPKSWLDGHPACPDYKYHIEDLLSLAYLTSSGKLTLASA